MPVPLKLVLALREKLGTEVGDELVDWLNSAEAYYMDARFERMESRFSVAMAQLEASLSALIRRA